MLPCATVLAVPPDAATYRASGLDAMGRAARQWHHRRCNQPMERPMPQPNDMSRSLITLEQDSTLIAVIEMGQSSWLVAGIVPGIERQPLKKLAADQDGLLQLLHRWRKEAAQAGHPIKRIAVAYEAGRWLLAGALAPRSRDRSLRDSPVECPGIARAQTGE